MPTHNRTVATLTRSKSMEFKTPLANTAAVLPAMTPSAMRMVSWISVVEIAACA